MFKLKQKGLSLFVWVCPVFDYLTIISSLPAPVPINLTGTPVNSSILLKYFLALSGSSSNDLQLLISPKFPSKSSYTA